MTQCASSSQVERLGGDREFQMRPRLDESIGAGQGATQRRARRRQVGTGQCRFEKMHQVARCIGQLHVQPPAQQVSLGSQFVTQTAGIRPGGPFPLDPIQSESA